MVSLHGRSAAEPRGSAAPAPAATSLLARAADAASRAVLVLGFLAALPVFALALGQHVLGYQSYAVLSGSMTPTLPVGSLVVSRPVPAGEIRVGDIITFHPPGQAHTLVTHRVHAIVQGPDGPQFVTKGDANPTPDRWRVPATGAISRERWDLERAGYATSLLQTPRARVLFLFLPACLLCLVFLVQLWRPEPDGGELRTA